MIILQWRIWREENNKRWLKNEHFCLIYAVSTQQNMVIHSRTIDFIFNEIKKVPDAIIGD